MKRALSLWPDGDPDSQAAYWLGLLMSDDSSAAVRKAFAVWRAESPANDEAFARAEQVWQQSEVLSFDLDIQEERRRILIGTYRPTVRRRLYGLAAVAVIGLFGALTYAATGLFQPPPSSSQSVYVAQANQDLVDPSTLRTEIGEQRSVTLSDGSVIGLNTDTEIRVNFSQAERSLVMLKGQAVFKVAHESDRPFVVHAAGRRITALGTEFEVRLGQDQQDISVTLLEGKVVVEKVHLTEVAIVSPHVPAIVELTPGERFEVVGGGPSSVVKPDLDTAMSWRNGRIHYESEPLSTFIYEFNRYSERRIILSDPMIGDIHRGGYFKIGSVDAFVTAVTTDLPLQVVDDGDEGTIVLDWKP